MNEVDAVLLGVWLTILLILNIGSVFTIGDEVTDVSYRLIVLTVTVITAFELGQYFS